MPKNEYLRHTRAELLFLVKTWETKLKAGITYQRNAMLNAYVNANRAKKDKFIPLFDQEEQKKIELTAEQIQANEELISICAEMFTGILGGENQ